MLLHTLSTLARLHELNFSKAGETVKGNLEKKLCESEISSEILKQYHIVAERYGKTALVPIQKNTCTGCFITQPRTGPNELAPGIYQCTHCGRFLFSPDDLL